MKKFVFTIALFLSLPFITEAQQQISASITVDNIKREFIVYLPVGTNDTDHLPVLIALHGNLGTPGGQIKLGDFRPIADKEKFIFVCPAGINRSWNDGRATKANEKGINDVKFIDELITHIIDTYSANAKRVYVTGMSNGGFMTSRLACELSNKIAAIAVVAASMDSAATYHPVKPMPVMYIQGTKDPLVPFTGGLMTIGAGGLIYGHEEVLKKWASANHCGDKPVVTNLPAQANDGTSVIKEEYSNPANNIKVIGYTVTGGGHTWPGGWAYLPKMIIGTTSRNLNACQEIWDFFKGYKL